MTKHDASELAYKNGYQAGRADMMNTVNALEGKIRHLEAERDAAVADIERRCYNCKHWNTELNNCPCSGCYLEASAYYSHAKWEWRGVQEEKNDRMDKR